MLAANQLKDKNKALYLLYMWQIEDIIRKFHGDLDLLEKNLIAHYDVDDTVRQEIRQWYANLCTMMREEGKMEHGHLQINNNVLINLADMNQQLLASDKFPYYGQMYQRMLPYIVELRAKAANAGNTQLENTPEAELEQLFTFLYCATYLKLEYREFSESTAQVVKDVTAFFNQLCDYYNKFKAGELEL